MLRAGNGFAWSGPRTADELGTSKHDQHGSGDIPQLSRRVRSRGNALQLRVSPRTGDHRAAAPSTPITRLAERNDYRETLINYQRARRDYLLFEDSIRMRASACASAESGRCTAI